ncbi:G patch domain-containing protein 4 [Musca autumnalis]|uniref:G patch domain-containing protein 4 n=1 Tax=Musca autumnalis TaxID=221902 RepID=UPI003CFAEAAC
MDYARKILEKYGWKDGDGLGKTNSGISKALRANLKFDTAGFGVDQAATDFNNHWWERVFNDAAKNVDIKQNGESVQVDLKNEADGVEITTKGYSLKKLKKAKGNSESYNNFIQSATLTSRGSEVEKDDRPEPSDIEIPMVNVLTDEELFKACGGRTAHKGARHGLKLSGKLARIEQQEKELLAKMMASKNKADEIPTKDEAVDNQEKKKKKRKNKDEVIVDLGSVPEEASHPKQKKKKKHNIESTIEDVCMEDVSVSAEYEENSSVKHKKKKKNKEVTIENTNHIEVEDKSESPEDLEIQHKKKKKKKRKEVVPEDVESSNAQMEQSELVEDVAEAETSIEQYIPKKKKSKKKSKSCDE